MRRFAASVLTCAMASVPAMAESSTKTQLVAMDGSSVALMRLREGSAYSAWVLDKQNVLYRDEYRDYYLVTLKVACEPLAIRQRSFAFHPGAPWRLKSTSRYEIRPEAGAPCEVARIERMDETRASPLRDASLWRAW